MKVSHKSLEVAPWAGGLLGAVALLYPAAGQGMALLLLGALALGGIAFAATFLYALARG
ncbi:hypothetical protein ACLSSQ_00445 [Azospira sp. APE16]|uniref:hypothetical protein n=1 Tax=unclassified Azospira TaxID=2609269 RepID=UPI0025659C34|nr:hypothetical protein [Azospira sp.]MDK9690537.1 hypothetical protein [Azospira sp.]